MKLITPPLLQTMKSRGEKIVCITAYDATFTHIINRTGIDVILVGDSLGQVIQGHSTTQATTLEHMAYHTRCVAQTNQQCLLISDLPFMTYATVEDALHSAATLIRAGAHMVKVEGTEWLAEIIHALTTRGIPVCGHMGLTPQSVYALGGYKIQGKTPRSAEQLKRAASFLAEAGASMLVLECIPQMLAGEITELSPVPTIGIGAGVLTDGQILVLYDVLGIGIGKMPKLAKNFLALTKGSIEDALALYCQEVKERLFPSQEQVYE